MPPELKEILLLGLLNPVALWLGYMAGRTLGKRGDQLVKIVVAGLPAGLAGVGFVALLMRFGFAEAKWKLLPGIFVVAMVIAMAAAWLGYWVQAEHRRHGRDRDRGADPRV